MVPGRSDMPPEPDPNPQSCETDYSHSRECDHQGCLGHFQEGQKGNYQVQWPQEGHPEVFPQLQCRWDLPLVKSVDGLSVVGLDSFHCILTQQVCRFEVEDR